MTRTGSKVLFADVRREYLAVLAEDDCVER